MGWRWRRRGRGLEAALWQETRGNRVGKGTRGSSQQRLGREGAAAAGYQQVGPLGAQPGLLEVCRPLWGLALRGPAGLGLGVAGSRAPDQLAGVPGGGGLQMSLCLCRVLGARFLYSVKG